MLLTTNLIDSPPEWGIAGVTFVGFVTFAMLLIRWSRKDAVATQKRADTATSAFIQYMQDAGAKQTLAIGAATEAIIASANVSARLVAQIEHANERDAERHAEIMAGIDALRYRQPDGRLG